MAHDLALHEAHNALAHQTERFNALAQVAAREMPKYLKPMFAVPLTIGVSALGAAAEARWGTKAMVANGLIAAVAYGVGMMAGDNADLKAGAYMIATGLGSSAASIGAYNGVTNYISQQVAPIAGPGTQAAAAGGAMVPAS